ncbi:MAG: VPDSG-CTERM sorting domain-containing protein [Chthoniobacterales bacterium]
MLHTGSVPDGGSTVSLLGFASLGLVLVRSSPPCAYVCTGRYADTRFAPS